MALNSDNITVVSGYWRVNNKYGGHMKYDEWFKNTLRINQRYYFFCDKSDIDYIKKFRTDLETLFIPYSLDSFHSSKYFGYPPGDKKWTHPTHVPSIEVSMIWHEKIHLIKMAKDADKDKQTEFYVWIDAGICNFRNSPTPVDRLNIDKNKLPHDKVCYSRVKTNYHSFSAGVLIMHKDIIDKIHDLYFQSLIKYQKKYNDWRCGSDQFIWTNMVKEYPNLFHKLSDGYGQNLTALYKLNP